MVKARIVITAFNSDEHLQKCVRCLDKQSRRDFEVVIVNNSDAPIAPHKSWSDYDWLHIIHADENTGFSGGSNLGAKSADTDWIITLNPDAWPRPDWFANLMMAADENPEYAMLSSTLVKAGNATILDGAGDQYSIFGIGWRGGQDQRLSIMPTNHREVLAPCGAAAAYRRPVFEAVSGFDEGYFCYLEDIDLGLRLQSQGHKCLHIFNAHVAHVGGGTTGIGSGFQLYYTHKNQLRLMAKLTPVSILLVQLPLYSIVQTYLLIRTLGSPHWRAKLRGLRDGAFAFPKVVLTERRKTSNQRIISAAAYARLVSWSLTDLRQKSL